MFDGAILDVVIGMLVVFLVSSLVASALVETVGGYLHRRPKHLWDTLDLLLGNTATVESSDGDRDDAPTSIVEELYRQPFITGLVRPTDRLRFDPAVDGGSSRAVIPPKQLPSRAKLRGNAAGLPFGSGTVTDAALRRRFYGPNHIDAREFTNALLGFLRPDGTLDRVRSAIDALAAAAPAGSNGDVAASSISAAVGELAVAADELRSRRLAAAVERLRAAGETIDVPTLRAAVDDARAALHDLVTGQLSTEEFAAMLDAVPDDLRAKLLAVAGRTGQEIVDLRSAIEDWYDRNMTAASAWYRKQTRYFVFIAGLVMAAVLNVDAVHAGTTLYRDESVRDAVVALAGQIGDVDCPDGDGDASGLDLDCVRDEVGDSLALPVGWSDADLSTRGWGLRILGWLTIAVSVTLGAPFWFDLLRRGLAHRRATSSG